MALVVFLRGVNVGGHRTFRPSVFAREMRGYGVVNVGAAGTFVVRKPGSREKLRAEIRRRLPFEAEIMLCDGRQLLQLDAERLFGAEPPRPDIVRFVSILSKNSPARVSLPIVLPPEGEWLLQVTEKTGRFVFGVYRRQMKAIGYLGQIDKLFGAPATTRNWNTITAIVRVLNGPARECR